MKKYKKWIFYLSTLIIMLPATWAAADEPMTVVANAQNQNKSQKWVDFLVMNEVEVNFVAPDKFDKVKTNKYVAIIGGVDDPAIKMLVSEILGAAEAEAMSVKGAKKMYVKEGFGAQDQKMLIFTGSDTEAAALARTESRDAWMPLVREWFELGEGPGSLKAY